MKIQRVPQLLYVFNSIIWFFSSSRHEQKLLVHHDLVLKSTFEINRNHAMLIFLVLGLCIVTILTSGSSKQSHETHSDPFASMLELYPLAHKVDEQILDETYSLTNIMVEDDDHEFTPRLVHLELIEGATGSHEDFKDVTPSIIHVKLIEGAIKRDDEIEEFHGYDGYDEDNDDEGDDDDDTSSDDDNNNNNNNDDDGDLTIRIEQFIEKNIRKWREEMLNDKLCYLEC